MIRSNVFVIKTFIFLLILQTSCMKKESNSENQPFPVYAGNDLGVTYSPENTRFRLWSPQAQAVEVSIYEKGLDDKAIERYSMERDIEGTWMLALEEDLQGKFYTYRIKHNGAWMKETPGPYAKAVGVNGKRGYILDLNNTDPEGWDHYELPAFRSYQDAVIYEIHIRDMSIHPSSGIEARGKYLGLTETGTISPDGEKTGIDHIEELGITHVHILPMFDFRSIDETKLEENKYNWGYDPANYNVPEGSYSTDPFTPETRIREMKEMILAFHKKGIRVILDVVYNHTGEVDGNPFNLSTPEYYYRVNNDGSLSDASACGNETASERAMMRKYMIESVLYWINEYKIDGFRFDLMGIHDIESMNAIREAVYVNHPDVILYGEGWKAGDSPVPMEDLALKRNIPQIKNVAAFSDEVRDGIKGSWNKHKAPGFINGNVKRTEGVKFGVVGGVNHPQINYLKIIETDIPWSSKPSQCMVYVSCHDNHTLYDKLKIVDPKASEGEILKKHIMANTIVLTSQGVPFLHAGVDFLRTKKGVENSFESPDSINQIDWRRKHKFRKVNKFYQDLIQLRKDHPAFKMPTQEMIVENLRFIETDTTRSVLGYHINGKVVEDSWNEIIVFHNAEPKRYDFKLPEGEWNIALEGIDIDQNGLRKESDSMLIPAFTSIIAFK